MSAPASKLVKQILDKYVIYDKLKAKLLEKCGSDFDVDKHIDVREDDTLIEVPVGKELTKDEIESLRIKRSSINDELQKSQAQGSNLLYVRSCNTMSFNIHPRSGTEEAVTIRETITEKLSILRKKHSHRQEYIPDEDLPRWVTKDSIGKWIEASKIDLVDPDRLRNTIHASGLKTFCVLLEIERENYIQDFIRLSQSNPDGKLWWTNGRSVRDFLLLAHSPTTSRPWSESKYDDFCKRQWKYMAQIFTRGEGIELVDDTILPYLDNELYRERGNSKLFKVEFDGRYLRPQDNLQPGLGNVIKMMRKELGLQSGKDESDIMRYIRARLEQPHPNIIELYAYYTHKGTGNLLMPLLQGDLKGLLRNDEQHEYFQSDDRYMIEMLNLTRAMVCFHQISEHHLYDTTCVHHDLKPDNVLLDNGKFVLSDFGISTLVDPNAGLEQDSYGHKSWYTAPESLRDDGWPGKASPKSDIFSLGCIFTELLIHMRGKAHSVAAFCQRRGSGPFYVHGNLHEEVVKELSIIREDRISVGRSQFAGVVLHMLALEPDDRLAAKEVVAKFSKILDNIVSKADLTGETFHHFRTLSMTPDLSRHRPKGHPLLEATAYSAVNEDRSRPGEQSFEPIIEVVEDLVGRENELRVMKSYLLSEKRSGCRIVILQGTGGIGKTQLASAYFNDDSLPYTSRFRVSGRNKFSFIIDFLKIAEVAGLDQNRGMSNERLVDCVWNWLNSRTNNNWLLFLDNVDNPGAGAAMFDIEGFLKRVKHGSIIITTRLNNLMTSGRCLQVELRALENVDSLRILEKNARRYVSHEIDCETLLEKLSGLPLPLVQAGAYLRNTRCSISTYLRFWNTAWSMLSDSLGQPSNYEKRTMATTWQVSYDRVQKTNPEAANLLKFWGFLDHRDLGFETIQDSKNYFEAPPQSAALVTAESTFVKAMGHLMENSFVTSTGGDLWSISSVLHRWVFVNINAVRNEDFLRWAVVCVGSKAEKRGTTDYWRTSSRLFAHAKHCIDMLETGRMESQRQSLEAWRDRLLGLSRICIAHDVNLEKVKEVLRYTAALDVTASTIPSTSAPQLDSMASLRALNSLGNLYRTEGLYTEATNTYRDLMLKLQDQRNTKESWMQDVCENYLMAIPLNDSYEHILDDPVFTSRTKDYLKIVHRIKAADRMLEQKDLGEAAMLFDALREEMELTSQNKMSIKVWKAGALCYTQRGDHGKAAEIFEAVLPVARKLRGGDTNSLTLDVLNNYGIVCRKLGILDRADDLLSAAEEGLRPRRGQGDGLYLNSAENLADLLICKGEYSRARNILEACQLDATGRIGDRGARIQNQMTKIKEHEDQSRKSRHSTKAPMFAGRD